MDCHSEGSSMVDNSACRWTNEDIRSRCRGQLITSDMLPDDVLIEIFDFYVDEDMNEDFERIEEWKTLAHVCRRWRSVVFQSPRRLYLRLLCTLRTPVRDTLDIWPPLPLIIHDPFGIPQRWNDTLGVDNIAAALGHNDRVCQIKLGNLTSSEPDYVTAMFKPFPELTHLWLRSLEDGWPILTDSFLGGTAPRLRSLVLDFVPFPGLLKLLLSATRLVHLDLNSIPRSGDIPPEEMATNVSALTSLQSLHLHFRYPRLRSALGSRPPPLTRSILPSLTKIRFHGDSEYLEEILAWIDAPQLDLLHITFFHQIVFDTPQLFQFISRRPTMRAPEKGHIAFNPWDVIVKFPSQTSDYDVLSVKIPCMASLAALQFSSLKQICTSSLPPVSTLEDLYLYEESSCVPYWQDDAENTLWLDLLCPFVAVKNLYLSEDVVLHIAPVLQGLVGGRTTEVLPTLESIFLKGFQPSGALHEGIEEFVATRRLTSHPVAVSRWDRERRRAVYAQ